MPFPPKAAAPAAAAALSADPDVAPAVSLGGGKGNLSPTKKAFGGPRTMTAGGGGGSKFGGFRKGGGVSTFSGGKR